MPSFFSSLADKAQSAINSSPLAGHIPSSIQSRISGQHGETQGQQQQQQASTEAPAQGGTKSHTLGALHHQFRSLQMQYATTSPVQRIITTQKGVSLAFDGVCKEAKSQSRELYTWGQQEGSDIKDVSDRLAYLNFVHGALSETLATDLDKSRAPLKALRDAENELAPRRNIRVSLETQIGRIEYDQPKNQERRLAELKQQLQTAEAEDAQAEREIELHKRKALRECEQLKWAAIREYGEKLVLLAEASTPIIAALPSIPPTATQPYNGAQSTAATRAALQHALDNYKPGSLTHSFQPTAADLSRSDSRSFGVTHASELSSIASNSPGVTRPISPPVSGYAAQPAQTQTQTPPVPTPVVAASVPTPVSVVPTMPAPVTAPPQPSPINPAVLNNAPASIPVPVVTPSAAIAAAALRIAPDEKKEVEAVPPVIEPTVAETGVPVKAGAGGPGPASGSLLDLKQAKAGASAGGSTSTAVPSTAAPAYSGPSVVPKHESAEEEKQRLQREERERLLQGSASGAPPPISAAEQSQKHETAEEEKKRLEKEERERLLQSTSGANEKKDGGNDDNSNPPPYQDI